MAKLRCAILDDYQNVALKLRRLVEGLGRPRHQGVQRAPRQPRQRASRRCRDFAIICAMRERTPFPNDMIEKLPDLKLLITTGMVNRGIDVEAAKAKGITVCGTGSFGNPTAGIAWGLILELTRHIGYENNRLKSGAPWQTTLGPDVEGMTLGIIGLGKLGTRVGEIGKAFRMKVSVWSQNITQERADKAGFDYAATKEDLLKQSDIVSIHIPLTPKSRGLLGAKELALLKPTALLINTSRGPIVDQAALLDVLRNKKIAGAGFDVYDVEPLPLDHPFRKLDNVVLTPHLGYCSAQNYVQYFTGMVEDIRGFLDGKPVRVVSGADAARSAMTARNILNGGQVIVDYLVREKVPYVFGLCGHGNIGLLDALYRARERHQDHLDASRDRRRLHGRRLLPRRRQAGGDVHLVRSGLGEPADRARQRVSRFRAVPRDHRQRSDQPVQPRRVPGALSALPGRLPLDRARVLQERVPADAGRHGGAGGAAGLEDHGDRAAGAGRARRAVRHLQGGGGRGNAESRRSGTPTSPRAAAPIRRA